MTGPGPGELRLATVDLPAATNWVGAEPSGRVPQWEIPDVGDITACNEGVEIDGTPYEGASLDEIEWAALAVLAAVAAHRDFAASTAATS